MKIFILTALIIMWSTVLAEDFRTNDGFTVTLPPGWVEIPQEILRNYEAALLEISQGKNLQKYSYGYQTSIAINWLEHPYILVQVKRDGRIPEGQLKKYKKLKEEFSEGGEKAEAMYSGFLSNAKQGETIYDDENHVLWSTLLMTVAEIGNVKALIAVKLTEFGFVQIMGYSIEEEFNQYEPIYKSMVNTLSLNEKDAYKPRLTDNAPVLWGINLGQSAIAGIIAGAIGGLIALVGFLGRRIKK